MWGSKPGFLQLWLLLTQVSLFISVQQHLALPSLPSDIKRDLRSPQFPTALPTLASPADISYHPAITTTKNRALLYSSPSPSIPGSQSLSPTPAPAEPSLHHHQYWHRFQSREQSSGYHSAAHCWHPCSLYHQECKTGNWYRAAALDETILPVKGNPTSFYPCKGRKKKPGLHIYCWWRNTAYVLQLFPSYTRFIRVRSGRFAEGQKKNVAIPFTHLNYRYFFRDVLCKCDSPLCRYAMHRLLVP